ncbi:hypothetical protein NDR87_12225 [Nocardia sp. CDC159]|uniref:Uncharacterized protein n=1 Tax=Nocardia pulmonis TaxID=2951408 RepID=A0A9X2E4T5_9NOCA|nr:MULTISPECIES: hypothetical protein [Nocardia]MCM6774239.1 hypothetical protein [Nocardia pulmonis]MCM6787126.1 hypothetical protein [Nocardia sp. CDC159]
MRDTSSRAVHFVGSFPAESTEDAMRTMLGGAGERLRTLPTGEVRRYEFYIQPIIADLVAQGVLEVRSVGSWETSRDRTIHRVPRGKQLRGEAMDLGYLAEAREALPLFRELRRERGLPELSLQIGMPTAFTLAFIAMGVNGVRKHKQAFVDASVRDIAAVRELAGDDVVIQLEATAELLLMAKTLPFHRLADRALGLAKGIAAMAAAAPAGTRFGVHLCLGSLRNRAGARPRDARPLVALANSVARHWPAGRPLEYVHGPLAAGDIPPSMKPSFYVPLRDLDLGPDTAFYAGLVHEIPSVEQQVQTLHTVEAALGRRVDGVASACGLGRRPRVVADAMVARAAEVADAP